MLISYNYSFQLHHKYYDIRSTDKDDDVKKEKKDQRKERKDKPKKVKREEEDGSDSEWKKVKRGVAIPSVSHY